MDFLDKEFKQRYGEAYKSTDRAQLDQLGRKFERYSTNTFGSRVAAGRQFFDNYREPTNGRPRGFPPYSTGDIGRAINLRGGGVAAAPTWISRGHRCRVSRSPRRSQQRHAQRSD
jgi:hypothetical protein